MIDTNVLISALIKPSGWEAQVLELVAYRVIELFVSAALLAEYRGVLARPKFARIGPERISRLLSLIAHEASTIIPNETLNISDHEEDNRFYECAAAAQADYLVTGNRKHFPQPFKTTQIVTSRQLVELLARQK